MNYIEEIAELTEFIGHKLNSYNKSGVFLTNPPPPLRLLSMQRYGDVENNYFIFDHQHNSIRSFISNV